jgi:hypothetical protein
MPLYICNLKQNKTCKSKDCPYAAGHPHSPYDSCRMGNLWLCFEMKKDVYCVPMDESTDWDK